MLLETIPGEKGMELFAVLAINAVVSVVLYYTITSKVTEKIRTHMLKRINEEIRDFVDELETESLRQVDLIGSRILTFKEMTFKVEELVKRIEQATTPGILDKIRLESPGTSNPENVNHFMETSSFASEIGSPGKNPSFSKVGEEEKTTLRSTNLAKIPDSVQQGIGYIYKENLDLVKEEGEVRSTPQSTPLQNPLTASASSNESAAATNSRIFASENYYIQKQKIIVSGQKTKTQNPTAAQTQSRNQNETQTGQGSTSNLVLETIGRGVRKFFGIQEIKTIQKEDSSGNDFFPGTRNSTLDISLDEDPFSTIPDSTLSETPVFKDNLKPADFGRILQENKAGYKPIKPDSTRISAEAALLEIGEDSTKIEKVVFLLKRKYTHEEISEVLDLALGEVDIIERFRLDRNRRF
ncbi:hypothetical protein GS511_03900 [Leptospira borgpetersenii]|uniref:Uncharacterized protein n=1 Tax=Leptospira borgpetersenii serovar Ballum TaxID=280505 RepID=A0A0E3B2Q6_LEPBO|nr:hypothetical protein LBBP_00930 [Leptospira borgpetersenii serovar Ballum]ANH00197.1 Uncharacterized protein LB4E_0729 [Leptospira borgpetersenii str. 4E]EKQ98358.1 hypothetical protein LEP1GSC121_3344 [Leptospira borgpetersenii serovar Castellonis str. 200801910]EMO07866.1 hypothetical protein LEP1GSC137_1734 [Leptospira borgpetersenii str. Noumea 25]QHE26216.1 hypothetical protein GS524_03900 [Leptospira borgpetersenii]